MRPTLAIVAIFLIAPLAACGGYYKPSPQELSKTVGKGKPAPGPTLRNPFNPDFDRLDDKKPPTPTN